MNVVHPVIQQAAARPNAPALITAQGVVTYRQLSNTVVQLASQMAHLGVRPGDVVGIFARRTAAHVWLTLATAYVGAVSVSLGSETSEEGMADAAELCGVKFLFHGDHETVKLDLPHLQVRMSLGELLALPARPEPVAMAHPDPRDIWRIVFSSGTTGRPKAIKLAHEATVLKFCLNGTAVAIRPGDRVFVQMSVGLSFPLTCWLRALSTGATVIASQESPAKAWDVLHRQEVTLLVSSPGNAMAMLAAARSSGAGRPPKLRSAMLAGAPVTPAQRQLLRQHICDDLLINYGATEVGMVALLRPALMDRDPACAGRVVEWVEVQALDDDGQVLPPGYGEGLLRMRSPTMASGYILPRDVNADDERAFRDGWFYTKDIGRVMPDGRVYLAGRASDVINLGGVKIDPARVEEVMAGDPSVFECALVGAPTGHGGVETVAVIVPQCEIDWARLQQRCKEVLPPKAVPRRFVTVDELPRNAGGKVMRDQLVRMLRSRAVKAVAP